jgi:hypothetical protein
MGGGAFEARSLPPTVPPPRNHHRRPPFPSPPHQYLSPRPRMPRSPPLFLLLPTQVTRDSLRRRLISPSHSREISGCPRHGRCLRPRATAGGRPLPPRRPPARLPPICAAGGATVAAAPVLRVQRGPRRGVCSALQASPPQVMLMPLPICGPLRSNDLLVRSTVCAEDGMLLFLWCSQI